MRPLRPQSRLNKVGGWILLIALLMFCSSLANDPRIGKKASEWNLSDWLNSKPLSLESLKGKVVLIRWWTAPHCPYCKATAPSLNLFHEKYGKSGLQVIGAYHHKSSTPLNTNEVKEYAAKFGFQFPVAIDRDWKTLKEWWLEGNSAGWTSVTFLLDAKGRIQFIHPGGEYKPGDTDFKRLETKIQALLREIPK